MKTTTLLFLIKNNQILLAMKKRRFGEGKWNGVGGKLDPGETIEQATIRECQEEINVTPENLNKVAEIDFKFPDNPDWDNYCHVYLSEKWAGEPKETEEMRPAWYSQNKLPLDEMWPDDKFWLPRVLAGERFKATFTFDCDQNLVSHAVEAVNGF